MKIIVEDSRGNQIPLAIPVTPSEEEKAMAEIESRKDMLTGVNAVLEIIKIIRTVAEEDQESQ